MKTTRKTKRAKSNPERELYIWDIETIPQGEAKLMEVMPPHLATPRLPDELEKPDVPDFSAKCPKYGIEEAELAASKAIADFDSARRLGSIAERDLGKAGERKDAACAKADEVRERRRAWVESAKVEWAAKHQKQIQEWNAKTADAKLKWIDDAALKAETAVIPLIGIIPPVAAGAQHAAEFFFIGTREEIDVARIAAEAGGIKIWACQNEAKLLDAFWARVFRARVDTPLARFAGFHSNRFDLPMTKRRSWINGAQVPVSTMSGSYADRSHWLCLHEEYQSGDRETRVGLDAVLRAFGLAPKDGSGESFWRLWQTDKTAAILYNLRDLLGTRGIAARMGFE